MALRYKWRTKPYAHQVRAIKKLLANGYGGALLMEPRTGKTKTTIDYASILALGGAIDRAVIIAPNRVLGVWLEEFLTHSPAKCEIQVWDSAARKAGAPRPPTPGYDLHVLIINYDAFGVPGKKLPSGRRSKSTGRFKIRKQVADWIDGQPCLGVLDESHKIKSPSGKAANMVVSMAPMFTKRVLLTGTPITKAKRAHDIYMQWRFLNPERFAFLPTVADFKDHYGRWTTANGFPQFLGGKNMEELQKLVHMDSFSVTRDECFDLPPRDTQIVRVELDADTGRAYDEMATDMVTQLKNGEVAEASIPLVQALRLAQITSGMVGIAAEYDEEGNVTKPAETVRIGTEKLRALEPLLDDAQEHDEKIVIAARFKADMDAIAELARSKNILVFQLRGGMKRHETDTSIREFRKHDGAAVFILQPAAGSLGIDLSTASRMVWYSLTTSWVDYTQACDRIALSRNSTTFTYLLGKGTVDEVIYQTMQLDGEIGRAILKRPETLLRTTSKDLALR